MIVFSCPARYTDIMSTSRLKSCLNWLLPGLILSLAVGLSHALPAAAQGPETGTPETPAPATATPTTERRQVGRFELIEWAFNVLLPYSNPFDPAQIDVHGIFTSPDGYQQSVPGFWTQPMAQTCTDDCAIEVLEPQGDPGWRVRFTPDQVGAWTYELQANTPETSLVLESGGFDAVESDAPGFVRVAGNARYFEHADGSAYFPIGSNLAWSWDGAGGIFAYQRWLRELAANGGNYARLYIDTPWFIGFEWQSPVGDYMAAQDDFWRLDAILQTAAEEGVYLDLVVLWHQALGNASEPPVLVPDTPPRADTGADWDQNPYNVINGGFLTSSIQFFTEPEAQRLFQQRLRYLVARWGYSPQVLAWELLSDADRVSGYTPTVILPWLETMAGALRDLDSYDHLISVGASEPLPELVGAGFVDFAQVHFYQRVPLEDPVDEVSGAWRRIQDGLRLTSRPLLLSEFSLSSWYEPLDADPAGVHVLQGLWASILSGAAGSGASWWWDTYLEPQGLFGQYQAIARFTADIPWNRLALNPIQLRLVADDPSVYQPLVVEGFDRRFSTELRPDPGELSITPDGVLPDPGSLSAFLFGQTFNNHLSQPQRYRVSAPIATQLSVRVASVSPQAGAKLVVRIDDAVAAQLALGAGTTDAELVISFPAGEHLLTLENAGDDWLEIGGLTLAEYVAPLQALGLIDREGEVLLALFHNRAFRLQQPGEVVPGVEAEFRTEVEGMAPGEYRVEYWDPVSGEVFGEERVQVAAESGVLTLELLPIERMIAVRVLPVEGLALPSPSATPRRPTATPMPTDTPLPPTLTETPTITLTATPSLTSTPSPTATASPTAPATRTSTATLPPTATTAPSTTPSVTPSRTPRPTASALPTALPTNTPTMTPTVPPSLTFTPTRTPTQTRTPTLTPTSHLEQLLTPRANAN